MHTIEFYNSKMAMANSDIAVSRLRDFIDQAKLFRDEIRQPMLKSDKTRIIELAHSICEYTRYIHNIQWRDTVPEFMIIWEEIIHILNEAEETVGLLAECLRSGEDKKKLEQHWKINVRLRAENLLYRRLKNLPSALSGDEKNPSLRIKEEHLPDYYLHP